MRLSPDPGSKFSGQTASQASKACRRLTHTQHTPAALTLEAPGLAAGGSAQPTAVRVGGAVVAEKTTILLELLLFVKRLCFLYLR